MKQFNFEYENDKAWKECKRLIEAHIDEIDADDYRAFILDVVAAEGAAGINLVKTVFKEAGISLQPFNQAILKIIAELTGLGEN